MKIKTVLAPTLALLLSGCVVGPNYKAPVAQLPVKYSEAKKKEAGEVTLNPWWEAFRDKKLNGLVQEGFAENLTVAASMERIVAAKENVTIARAGGIPQITSSASAEIAGDSDTPTTRTLAAQAQASWLLDFFGQYKRSTESAKASLDAAYDDVNVARLAFMSELSNSYVEMRYYQEAIALTRKNLASRRETLKLIEDIRAAGSASLLDVIQAEGLVNQALSEIPILETNYYQSANHVATLLAKPAASMTAGLARGQGQPVPRYSSKVGIPADLIRNRPDIRKEERLLAAATADIGVAEAQLYPSITLGGFIGGSNTYSNSSSHNLLSWGFGPALDFPLFDAGVRKANVKIASSLAEQQYIAWKQQVLDAVEEVENAQIALHRDYQTVAALRRLVASYEQALSLSRESYKAGTATVLDILDAERNVANGRLSLAASIRNLGLDFIALNVAIGGGSDLGGEIKSQ